MGCRAYRGLLAYKALPSRPLPCPLSTSLPGLRLETPGPY